MVKMPCWRGMLIAGAGFVAGSLVTYVVSTGFMAGGKRKADKETNHAISRIAIMADKVICEGEAEMMSIRRTCPKSKRGLNQETLNSLFQAGVIETEDDVFKTDFSDGSVPALFSQAKKGNHVEVGQLLSLDNDTEKKYTTRLVYGSRTPLHQAAGARKNRVKTCKLLLDFDEWQLSKETNDGRTPYHMVHESDDDGAALIELFLAKSGVEMLAKKCRTTGSNCLHLACSSNDSRLEMVKAVLKADAALVNVVEDEEMRTPLHLASMAGHADVVKFIVGIKGVQVASKDRHGKSPFELAVENGKSNCADILQEYLAREEDYFDDQRLPKLR